VLEESCVLFDELLFVLRQIFQRMDRVRRTGGNAGAAIDASLGIDIHLSLAFETGLVGLGMDAVGGANLDAEGILNAGISNYIGHDESVSWNEHFRLAQERV
jgi:hypothetical protein